MIVRPHPPTRATVRGIVTLSPRGSNGPGTGERLGRIIVRPAALDPSSCKTLHVAGVTGGVASQQAAPHAEFVTARWVAEGAYRRVTSH